MSIITTQPSVAKQTVLLLGNYRLSLAIARQLGKAGHRVVAGGARDGVIARCIYVERVWDHPSMFKNERVFLAALDELLAECPDISMIMPVSEVALLKLVKMRDQLPRPLAAVSRETVDTCCDKGKMALLAAELDVPQAPFATVDSMEALVLAGEQVGYPCVARPNDGRNYDVKAYFINNRQHLHRLFPEWPSWHESLLVQAHAKGPRYNRYFVADEGVILDSLDVKIERTDRADGSGYAVEGVSVEPVNALDAPCQRLIEKLEYSGVGCIQYLIDERRGRISFLEINPRIGGNYAFPNACGLDLVTPMMALALGIPLASSEPASAHTFNKRFIWLYGDLIGLMSSVYKREMGLRSALGWLFKSGRGLLRADTHLTFERSDLGPSKWFAKRIGEALLVIAWDLARYVKRKIASVLRL
ncbi:hypothetical protein EYC98_08775 [Halieaceae bacterium IMCC14734]|uniref:ATP-grasp domain-containing protein n=1 Tax=Candidatus Litorirhabdus singularis TaxID=2518993 RepID=A0ABT3TFH6_9GAMM|nr:hypothetical protein [Candidatus Litorirhabdus singularis]MCX2980955.1 hypothetical protein [Candidatus Litorirhabdus singularis]